MPLPSQFTRHSTHQAARGVGSLFGLDGAGQAALSALAEGTSVEALRAALDTGLSALWRCPVMIAPTGTVSALQRLGPVLAPGDRIFAAPEVFARDRAAADALSQAGFSVEAASLDDLVVKLAAAAEPAGCWYVGESARPRDGHRLDLEHLWAVMVRAERLRVWLDDTGGLGWHGQGGRGLVLDAGLAGDRLVMSAELAPAFGAEVGVVATHNEAWMTALRGAASPAWPSSAVRLAAAAALTDQLAASGAKQLQRRLDKRLQVCDRLLKAQRLPQAAPSALPYRYVATGAAPAAHALVAALLEAGYLVSAATIETAQGPMPALRFGVTLAQPIEALQGLVEVMASRFDAALEAAGVDPEALRARCGLAAPSESPTTVNLRDWRASRLTARRDSRMQR